MSSFPSNRQLRTPIAKIWSRFEDAILKERRYKADRPPFRYFPTVSTVVDFVLCPVAGVHHFFYGVDNALIEPYVEMGSGRVFQEFISHFKSALVKGECTPTLGGAKHLYDEFTRGKAPEVRESCWRVYVSRWVERKLEQLEKINGNTKMYFQVHGMSDIKIEGGECHYPLMGRIDELDVTNKKIVERTILPSDGTPPAFKDFQVWLYWKLLCSISKKERPDIWKNEDFEDYELVVETPGRDFEVKRENSDFCKWAHDAYSWIYDLSSSKASHAIMEAYEEARKFCNGENKWDKCVLHHRYCFTRGGRFPLARKAMHCNIRKFYINLLFEQMWSHHLFMYQLLKLPISDLSGRKIMRGRIEQVKGDDIFIALESAPDPLLEKEEEEEIYDFDVIFGTLRMGLYRRARKRGLEKNILHVRVKGEGPLPTEINILLPQTSVYREDPWFLYRVKQREMRSFERWGLDREDKAIANPFVQFVEAAFGGKRLIAKAEAEGKNEGSN